MRSLHHLLDEYLQVRRALGYKLSSEGQRLPNFATFLQRARLPFITTESAMAWAMQSPSGTPRSFATRLRMVRGLARYVRAQDARTQIPPMDLLPHRRHRGTPYLYSTADVRSLTSAARVSLAPFRSATYRTLIGLLASTGMRVGEAIALDRSDFDVGQGVLLIRCAKFGKSRYVPLHSSTRAALTAYSLKRDRTFRRVRSPSFFLSLAGTRLIYKNVQLAFQRLVGAAGLADRPPRRPRIHDLRHTFAVRTLVDWYRAGLDVEARLPWLSMYLGHVSPTSTYWYLTATPELLTLAHRRLERFLEQRS